MRICFVSYDYPTRESGGGVGRQVQLLARRLVQAGHDATVIALGSGEPIVDEGVPVHFVTPTNFHWYVYRIPKAGALFSLALREVEYARVAFRVIQALHMQKPFDLIEGTETGAYGLSQLDKRVPLVIRLHGEQYTIRNHTPSVRLTTGVRLGRWVQRRAIGSARLLISPSNAHAQEISKEFEPKQLPIVTIPNCVEIGPLPETQVDRGLHVLYVGRLEKAKGILELLQAATQVLKQLPEVRFVLAGAAHPSLPIEELDGLILQYGLSENVERLGQVGREALDDLYRTATLCVLPSYYETFGLAALEAMALGVPVVGTRVGGLPEVVEEGVTGLLVNPGDAAMLAAAMLALLTDGRRRAQMGAKGRERAEALFSAEKVFDLDLAAYHQAIHAIH